ncbi:MAG: hypothetical protein ACT4QC_08385 [Planctomycetaceae bacterium]
MRPRRVAVAVAVVAFIVCGHAYDIARFCEHWPFSNYSMYCGVATRRETEVFRACGVTPRQEEIDVPGLFYPFDPIRLSRFLSCHRDAATLSAAANALLKLAQQNPGGADLTGVRIYRCRWQHDQEARNLSRPERTLLAESTSPRGARP